MRLQMEASPAAPALSLAPMTFIAHDHREGHLKCDYRLCETRSPTFVAKLGGDLPNGWIVSDRFGPGPGRGHLCPAHAELEHP
jgi:hypothetical protein